MPGAVVSCTPMKRGRRPTGKTIPSLNTGTNDAGKNTSRRTFAKATGAAASGLLLKTASISRAASGTGPNETLALRGGPKAVTLPVGDAARWPIFGEEEEQAVLDVLRRPGYTPIADLEHAKRRLTRNTRAMLPVHFNGLPCDMDRICEFAKEKGLIVMENACHADGATLQGKSVGSWGSMAAFSFQYSKPLPSIEGGLAVYQTSDFYERGSTLANTDNQRSFREESPYRKYDGSGLGLKLRLHPMSAAIARIQLRKLDEHNARKRAAIRRLNDRLAQLPGLSEPPCRPDAARTYFSWNLLLIDEAKAGMSRAACVKALSAEGVDARAHVYTLQHKLALYSEAQWWHHTPAIPELPASERANSTAIALPRFTSDVPELAEQYVKAFEKVWAHRRELGDA